MTKVIKVLGSKNSDGMDLYTQTEEIYPFLYQPDRLQEFIYSIENGEDNLYAWDEADLNADRHLEVASAEDVEILYEAEE